MVVPILSDCRQRKISLSTIFLLMTSVSFVRKACETRKPGSLSNDVGKEKS